MTAAPRDSFEESGTPEPRIAGRDLDAEIAEKVMGWTRMTVYYDRGEAKRHGFPPTGYHPFGASPPNYSTQLEYAWILVEELQGMGYRVHTTSHAANADSPTGFDYGDQCCEAVVERYAMRGCFLRCVERYGQTAPTLPLAICRATLATIAAKPRGAPSRDGSATP